MNDSHPKSDSRIQWTDIRDKALALRLGCLPAEVKYSPHRRIPMYISPFANIRCYWVRTDDGTVMCWRPR